MGEDIGFEIKKLRVFLEFSYSLICKENRLYNIEMF